MAARPPEDSKMTKPAKRKNVYMDEGTSLSLKMLGDGNVSRGIREVVRLAEAVKRDNPEQRTGEDA